MLLIMRIATSFWSHTFVILPMLLRRKVSACMSKRIQHWQDLANLGTSPAQDTSASSAISGLGTCKAKRFRLQGQRRSRRCLLLDDLGLRLGRRSCEVFFEVAIRLDAFQMPLLPLLTLLRFKGPRGITHFFLAFSSWSYNCHPR